VDNLWLAEHYLWVNLADTPLDVVTLWVARWLRKRIAEKVDFGRVVTYRVGTKSA
jgi:hypothetical protein